MAVDVKQSDNICTQGYRNIWGKFSLEELTKIKEMIPEIRLSHTNYSPIDINHPDRLRKLIQTSYIDKNLKPFKEWAYYIDYPEQYHERLWTIIGLWMT